jgi:hypothetical protein
MQHQNEVLEVLMSVMSPSAQNIFGDSGGGAREARPFQALLVYEDLSTGLRARQTLEEVARQLGPDGQFKLTLWKFDLLAETSLLEQATREAANADIVFLSAHGHRELPTPVREWYEQWLESQCDEPKAVALSLDARSRDTDMGDRIFSRLQDSARRFGAKVFVHFGSPEPTPSPFAPRGGEISTTTRSARLGQREDWFEDHPSRDWGLNE